MKYGISLKLLVISFLFFNPATARLFDDSEIKFIHLLPGTNQTENSITCFLQDRQGFMWIGTKGGLFRYDGYNFTSFNMEPNNENSLSDNYIRCMIEYSRDELILIGTNNGGLNIYDKKTGQFSRFLHNEDDSTSIGSNTIFDLLEDEDGNIWLATILGGLNLFDIGKKVFKKYFIDEKNPGSLSKNYIKCLYLDKSDGLWVGTRFLGLYLFDRKSEKFLRIFKESENPDNIPADNIWSITKDHANNLWIGTKNNGVFHLKKDNKNNYRSEKLDTTNGLYNPSVIKIFCDNKGIIWAGIWAGGLYQYNDKTRHFNHYKNDEENPQSLSSNHVLTIYEDNAGTLWIGTHAGGINIVQPKKWKFHPHQFNKIKKNTVHVNEVRSIFCQEQLTTLWIGTTKGLFKLNTKNGDSVNYRHIPGSGQSMIHNVVNDICQGKDQNFLWIGTPIGLTFMNTITDEFIHYKSNVIDSSAPYNINITKILRDKEGILWIGTTHIGLVRFDPAKKEFKTYRNSSNISTRIIPLSIRTIFEDNNGKLYIGTSNGIHIFDKRTERFNIFSKDLNFNSLLNTSITTIHRDSQNILWIGTSDYGIIKYDQQSGTFKYFSKKDGLASNYICGILEDKNGIFYISTDNGISRFDLYKEEFINYGIGEGLHGTEFMGNAHCKSKNGKMFFGGINGFTYFVPEEMVKNDFIPPVYITKFKVLNSQYNPVENILYTSSIKLSYKMNSFSMEFVALNYINSQKNQYLYKLEGYDQEWHEGENIREVVYKNVAPGNYTFRVIGSNNDGIWNEQGDTLSINIKPPIWKTWSFRIIISLLTIGLIFYIIRRRFALLKRETDIRRRFTHALIKNQEFERKRIAAELHDSLGQDLLVIKNQTNLVLRKEKKRGTTIDRLEQICSIADEAIANIRQISYNLHPYQLEKIGLTDALKSMIDKINEASNIKFEYEIDDIDGLLHKEQEINCYRVLQELLNNILKHSKAIKAWIEIKRSKQLIDIRVKDDGIGFDYEIIKNENQGFGLSGVKERIEILQGKLELKSSINGGASVTIEIPIGI